MRMLLLIVAPLCLALGSLAGCGGGEPPSSELVIIVPDGYTGFVRVEVDPENGQAVEEDWVCTLRVPRDGVMSVRSLDYQKRGHHITARYESGTELMLELDPFEYGQGRDLVDAYKADRNAFPLHASVVSSHLEMVEGVDRRVLVLYIGEGPGQAYFQAVHRGETTEALAGKDLPELLAE